MHPSVIAGQDDEAGPTVADPARVRLNIRACVACRNMKMRCEGAEDPPCKRCRKVGRVCVPQSSSRRHSTQPLERRTLQQLQQRKDEARAPSSASNARPVSGNVPLKEFQESLIEHTVPRQSLSDLPSIYSTSPADAIDNNEEGKRRRSEKRIEICSIADADVTIPKQDLRDMIHMFQEKLLPFLPVLWKEDFTDVDHLVAEEQSLVHCICYATARFLPGGKVIRDSLLPKVGQLLKGRFTDERNEFNEISNLKALFILYAYADFRSPTDDSEVIPYWPLKSVVEMYAMRLSLHNSVQELKADIRAKTPGLASTLSHRKYNFWLQLFVMAHHRSIISGTPPSIRIDSTIRAAPAILREVGPPHSRLIGEVELCLIWEKASAHQHQIGEWWCLPHPSEVLDENATQYMLIEADKMIDEWYGKWESYIYGEAGGAILDFLGRYTRFCIRTYAIRCLKNSPQGLSLLQSEQVQTCVEYAIRVLEWPVALGPIQKDRLRYVTTTSSVMLSFCCLFVLASCKTFTSSIPDVYDSLDKVGASAQLMMDLSIDVDFRGHIQGSNIAKRVQELREELTNAPPNELDLQNFDFSGEVFESFWDFNSVLPNPWYAIVK